MDPVNAPGMIRTAAIGMFDILGQDEKFIGPYFKMLSGKFIPSMSIHAVKKKIFRQPFFAVSIVVFCFGVIPDGTDMKVFQQEVSLHSRFKNGAGDFNPLSPKAVPDIFMGAFFVLFFLHMVKENYG